MEEWKKCEEEVQTEKLERLDPEKSKYFLSEKIEYVESWSEDVFLNK